MHLRLHDKLLRATETWLGCLLVLFLLGAPGAVRAEESVVTLRLPFYAEAKYILTACGLQVRERQLNNERWWEQAGAVESTSDLAMKQVVKAMRDKDRDALFALSDPVEGRDGERFDTQASAFFEQFVGVEVLSIPRAYLFDGMAVFFAEVRRGEKAGFVSFAFRFNEDGSYKFLPYRTTRISYVMVTDWFDMAKGKLPEAPMYLSDEEVGKTTHVTPVLTPPVQPLGDAAASMLVFTGFPADAALETPLVTEVKQTLAKIKEELAKPDLGEVTRHMLPKGAGRLKKWLVTAKPEERAQYRTAILGQEPVFVMDAGPIAVAYLRSRESPKIEVMYFIHNEDKTLAWTNSSNVLPVDQIFKSGVFDRASLEAPPFGSLLKK
ncbi:hypothetical protein [Brevifollis gellanilyticus]|uniref:Uncharacterized protein n=1 Tax=Brevifollis gellanilyticus TaxID=748831 RepID=A0A512M5Q1_9BACT|nr:hypothetical protein [Brevifollis gellanilyticus]GEP42063.1 hypothetical protein BGE01nite_13540 [Brevifollis gellanilyticus]